MTNQNAKFKNLYESLKERILSGQYNSDSPLPSLRAIMKRYGLSSSTVRRAFAELEHEGLVVRNRGSGTFVTKSAISRKIGLIVPSIAGSESFPEFVSAISRIAQDKGYTLLFSDISYANPIERASRTKEFAKTLIDEDVAGVIYLPLEFLSDATERNLEILRLFVDAHIPVVLLDRDVIAGPGRSSFDIIGINNVVAGQRLASHLLSMGAKKVGFLVRPNCAPIYQDRINGAMTAIRDAGFKCDRKKNVLVAQPTNLTAVKAFIKRERPDAFICSSDTIAAQFAKTLVKVGVRVPADMMLAGFNDLQLARVLTPSLTTIHSPCSKIAAAAFQRLLQRMENPELQPMELLLPCPLIIRESTRGWRGMQPKMRKGVAK